MNINKILIIAMIMITTISSNAASVIKPEIKKISFWGNKWHISYNEIKNGSNLLKEELFVDGNSDRVVTIGTTEKRGFPLHGTYASENCHKAYVVVYDTSHNIMSQSDEFLFGDTTKCNGVIEADTINPLITLRGDGLQTIVVGTAYQELGATASDNKDGDLTNLINIDATEVDTTVIGEYSITYSVVDRAGNDAITTRQVHVVAKNVLTPVEILSVNYFSGKWNIFYKDVAVSADLTVEKLFVDGTFDRQVNAGTTNVTLNRGFSLFGTYDKTTCHVAYIVIFDTANQEVSRTEKFNFGDMTKCNVDTVKPVITLTGTSLVQLTVGDAYQELGATAIDDVDGDITANIIIDTTAVNMAVAGRYSVSYDVSDVAKNSATTVTRTIMVNEKVEPCITLTDLKTKISNDEDVTKVNTSCITNMSHLFENNSKFNQDISAWDVSNVTDMSYMFLSAKSFNQDISSWDVSKVTNMSLMFTDAKKFNQDIRSWDVSNVTNMMGLFYLSSSFNQDISSWDVSNVTNMNFMFFEALEFNQPLNSWNVSKVKNMSMMFVNDKKFNQPLENWDVSSVINMSLMFDGAINFNQPLENWDVSSVTNMEGLLAKTKFNQPLENWNVSNVTSMASMFAKTPFNQPIENWDVSSVTAMNAMFVDTPFNQSLENWDVSSVTTMNAMFVDTPFNQPLANWDVSSVTTMYAVFANTPFNQPIGNWNTSSVTNIEGMFADTPFNQPIGNWDVSHVTRMGGVFADTPFNQPIGNWDTSSVTYIGGLFDNAKDFNQPIGSWNLENVTYMGEMFYGASSFNQPLENWNMPKVKSFYGLFRDAIAFNQDISNWDTSNVTSMWGTFWGATSFSNQDLSSWDVANVTDHSYFEYKSGTGNIRPHWIEAQ